MPTVIIPFPLRPHTDGQREVNATGATVAEVLTDLLTHYPGLSVLREQAGLLSVFINGTPTPADQAERDSTPVAESDEISLIIPIAGG